MESADHLVRVRELHFGLSGGGFIINTRVLSKDVSPLKEEHRKEKEKSTS